MLSLLCLTYAALAPNSGAAGIMKATVQPAASASSLEAGFAQPPASTKPFCYWYWISDNLSKEGITKDLESMAKVGIGEAYIGNVDTSPQDRGKVKVLSEEWWKLVEHAVREGKRLGVNIGMFNCPGWSQSGGPWVMPTETMRYVAQSETRVHGPALFKQKLAAPTEIFQPIATLAFPAPAEDQSSIRSLKPRISSGFEKLFDGDAAAAVNGPGRDKQVTIDIETSRPLAARSLTLKTTAPVFISARLQTVDESGRTKEVCSLLYDRHRTDANAGPLTFGPENASFPAATARHFRVILSGDGALGEIELSGAARLEKWVSKTLGKTFQEPQPDWATYMWPTQTEPERADLTIAPDQIINLTSKVGADGSLSWQVPPGDWIILQSGMAPTGVKNGPASPEGTGYEIDKMSRPIAQRHFAAYLGNLIKRMPKDDRAALRHVVADSYEQGAQNWTDGFAETFHKRYGYDPLPFLPVFGGRIVRSADASERFLWDLRRLIADRIATEYVGSLRDESRKHGLTLWLENYGHWGFVGEFMSYGSQSEEIGGEFWTGGSLGDIELRDAASTAHVYGKPVVHAEAWTSGGPLWALDPWALKLRGDWAATEGINHFVMHVYIHQPSERSPGVSTWFGTEFNRHNTWFPKAGGWINAIRRQHYLLQQGRYVADVAYFIGEDAPKMTGVRKPDLPKGYSFDYIDAKSIMSRLKVVKGRLTLPDGLSYRVLVLPPQSTLRPEVLRRIRDLVAQGATIVGAPPKRSPSLENFPRCDAEVQMIAKQLWASDRFGKGRVLQRLQEALDVEPDISGLPESRTLWIHRTTKEGEIYFITNQTDEPAELSPSFRVSGLQPELWDWAAGSRRDLPEFSQSGGRTTVPLELVPRESVFVVFRRSSRGQGLGSNFPTPTLLTTLDGPWNVSFDPAWRGPGEVTFDRLVDWTSRPEEGIRHYSGTAVYRKRFELSAKRGSVFLDLGGLSSIAQVRVNGQDVGLVWCAPWKIDVTQAVHVGANKLEVEITNSWQNRLVGDQSLPEAERKTSASVIPFNANSGLLRAGLFGPVRIVSIP